MSVFLKILKKRDYWPLFGAQAFGAFNDNFFRAALGAYIAFQVAGLSESQRINLNSLAMALMMLPFFLFSSLAGELADKFRKSTLIKINVTAQLMIMALAAIFFVIGHYQLLLLILFFMGLQSAFFGPLKYGLLPEVLNEKDLLAGNGLFEATTFMAIVFGSMLGAWLVGLDGGSQKYIPLSLAAAGLISWFLAMRQPMSNPGNLELEVTPKLWQSTWKIISSVRGRDAIWLSILAISWFWGMGAILMSQLPNLTSDFIGGTPAVNTFLLTTFCVGVGLGSIMVQWFLKGNVSARLVPVSAALICVAMIDLAFSTASLPKVAAGSVNLTEFLSHGVYLRLAVDCLLVSIIGGVFVVPLNAILQREAGAGERSRVIAANNIINALFICLGSLVVFLFTWAGFSLSYVFAFVALTSVIVAFLTLYFLPQQSLINLAGLLLKIIYRPKIEGLENFKKLGDGPALLVANHTSFLDVVLLVVYIPRRLTFAIDSHWAKVWWLKPFLKAFTALPINPSQPMATRGLIEALNRGDMVVIFPEGRITTTGSLMKVYDGSALIAEKSKTPILPVIIDGPQYSRIFGRFGRTLKYKPKVRIKVSILPPGNLAIKPVAGEKQKNHRRRAGDALYNFLIENLFQSKNFNMNLWSALVETGQRCGLKRPILEDVERKTLTYRQVIWGSKIIGRKLAKLTSPREKIGVVLPNVIPAVLTLFGLWAGGRVPVMLNYTQGPGPMGSAINTAQVKTVVTSRRFLEQIGLHELITSLPVKLFYLEDLNLTLRAKIVGLLWKPTPAPADAPAVMVFTSGSEGRPKGVALSHKNILANIYQVKSQAQVSEKDVLFNALPMFHAFGLSTGTILPLILGMKTFTYLSPLHAKIIPELIYDTRCTITVASDTFAHNWAKNAHPYDFTHMNLMLVGAEKLKDKTRNLYFEKLGVCLFEGYGVTEASPIIAFNNHMHNRKGAVGPVLPGFQVKIEPVEGVKKGGRLLVKGPSVMMGYIYPDNPGVVVPLEDGWHDTGDIADLDGDGYLWLLGRYKRFAKIAGEMVSLAAIEEVMAALWPGQAQLAAAVEDEQKGERLIVVTEDQTPDLPSLWQALKAAGQSELTYPKQFVHLPEIPMTPLGKINMVKVAELVQEALAK